MDPSGSASVWTTVVSHAAPYGCPLPRRFGIAHPASMAWCLGLSEEYVTISVRGRTRIWQLGGRRGGLIRCYSLFKRSYSHGTWEDLRRLLLFAREVTHIVGQKCSGTRCVQGDGVVRTRALFVAFSFPWQLKVRVFNSAGVRPRALFRISTLDRYRRRVQSADRYTTRSIATENFWFRLLPLEVHFGFGAIRRARTF